MPKMMGQGSIYQNKKNGKWVAQFRILNDDGSISKKSFTTQSKDEAYSKLAKARYELDNTKTIQDVGVNLVDLIKLMREDKFNANIIGEAQYHRLNYDIKRIEDYGLGNKNIQDITYKDIQNFLNYLNDNYSASTRDHTYQLIEKNMEVACKKKFIKDNPCDLVIKPRAKKQAKKIEALTIDEQQKLSSYLMNVSLEKEPLKNVFLIQMYMGLRISETLALLKNDFNLKENMLHICKTITKDKYGYTIIGKGPKTEAGIRDLPIPYFLLPYIKEQLSEADKNKYNLLFYKNHILNHSNANAIFKRICNNLNIFKPNLSTHVLRHTYGTRCIESGMPPVVLQRLMGHTDIKITLNTYTSVLNKFKEDEIDKVSQYYAKNNLIMKLGNREENIFLDDTNKNLESDDIEKE